MYTSGGAFSYVNRLIYLIEIFAGRQITIQMAEAYMIDTERDSQSPFIIFERQKKHNNDVIKKVQAYIEVYFQQKIAVEQLAAKLSISRLTLERRFKIDTSNSVAEYAQYVKWKQQKEFETGDKDLSEVMFSVSYAVIRGPVRYLKRSAAFLRPPIEKNIITEIYKTLRYCPAAPRYCYKVKSLS